MKKICCILLGTSLLTSPYLISQNVGIGTANPQRKLHIDVGNFVFSGLMLTNTATGATSNDGIHLGIQYQADNAANRYGFLNVKEDIPFFIGTNSSNYLTISNTGNFGFGVSSPEVRMEVDGILRLRGLGALEKRVVFRDNAGTADMGSIGHLNDNVISIASNKGGLQFSKFYFDIENEKMGVGAIPGSSDGKILVSYNSSTGNPHLTLRETTVSDYSRLEFANTGGTRVWHIAGQVVAGTGTTNRENDRLNIWNSGWGDIMTFRGDGRVGIRTTNPAVGYALSVDGKIICEELRVQLSGAWPDYVFQDQYQLPSLQMVENFIRTQKHLPGIPTAAQIEKEGLDMGDMQKRMMEKIEELTLYVIQQQKEIDLLKKQLQK